MRFNKLGKTELKVSAICLGSQTWGEQNTERQSHEQLDLALDLGINFIDTAEVYPFPPKAQTCGKTETIIGNWINTRKCRDRIILATKVTSRSNMNWFGVQGTRLTRSRIESAIDSSLKRLRTDYIDLYQLHWPDRYTNFFGRLGYNPDPETDYIPLEDQLEVLTEIAGTGKIRHIGVSNETPWGLLTFINISKARGWPRVVSIQNPYSLVNRTFEVGLAEIAIREQCGLLAYSPLAFGLLTGKYESSSGHDRSRLTLFKGASKRYIKPRCIEGARIYIEIARRHGLKPSQMALAFNDSRPFITSTIISATTLEQLKDNVASISISLSQEVIDEIETAHDSNPYPCP